jgi:hypothetical protein
MTYLKAFLASLVSFAGALTVALGTGSNTSISTLSTLQWLVIAGTVLGSGGIVAWVENIPQVAPVAKAVVSFLSAGIASLVTALSNNNHISQAEFLVAFVAAVLATGLVYQAPGKPTV